MKPPIRRGGVYWVRDTRLTLPPEPEREIKSKRPVIVVSGDDHNEDADWPIALVVPISTSPKYATEFCQKLAARTANLPQAGWARVVAVQPVAKSEFLDYIGTVPSTTMALLTDNLFAYMGLVG